MGPPEKGFFMVFIVDYGSCSFHGSNWISFVDLLEKSRTGNTTETALHDSKSFTCLSFLARSTPLSDTFPCDIDLFHQDTEIVVTLPRTGDLDESCEADTCHGMEV